MAVEGGMRGETPWFRPSNVALTVVLITSGFGVLLLARQPLYQNLAALQPEPAWATMGHDAARTGHSLSGPAPLPEGITRLWRRDDPVAVARRPAVAVDGNDNVYLARSDGALLFLSKGWCAPVQPVAEAACGGTGPEGNPSSPLPPNALIGRNDRIYVHVYVVDGRGQLVVFDPSLSAPRSRASLGLVPDAGLVLRSETTRLYGVVRWANLVYGVQALQRHDTAATTWTVDAGWHTTPIRTRALTPVSIAPDGTVLVAASAPLGGGAAWLYALNGNGSMRWHVPLAPGRPSYVTVEGSGNDWVAWVAVSREEPKRSAVFVIDPKGHSLWHWSVGHTLGVTDGGIALADPAQLWHSAHGRLVRAGQAYVSSTVGVYALDLQHRRAWLFLDTRTMGSGIPGPPLTDVQDNVYVATDRGHVYSIDRYGRERWRYDTGRDARGPLALDPHGFVVVISRDPHGGVVAELLGAGGVPLSSATGVACAGDDCPTPTAVPTATVAATGTPAPTTTAQLTGTPMQTPTAPVATSQPSSTPSPIAG